MASGKNNNQQSSADQVVLGPNTMNCNRPLVSSCLNNERCTSDSVWWSLWNISCVLNRIAIYNKSWSSTSKYPSTLRYLKITLYLLFRLSLYYCTLRILTKIWKVTNTLIYISPRTVRSEISIFAIVSFQNCVTKETKIRLFKSGLFELSQGHPKNSQCIKYIFIY